MKNTTAQNTDRQDALAWIAGRLVWDSRLTELRTGDVDTPHLENDRAA